MEAQHGILIGIIALVLGYMKLIYLPKKKVEQAYEELEEAKNQSAKQEKDSKVQQAEKDYADAVNRDTAEWLANWLKRGKRSRRPKTRS